MNRWKLQSTFQKMALSFLLLGVLPLLLVCLLFLNRYETNTQLSISSTMREADYYAQTKVADLLGSIDRSMEYLYDYSNENFELYELLEDDTIGENERKMHVELLLDEFIHIDTSVSAAYFVTNEDEIYNRFYSQKKTLRTSALNRHTLSDSDSNHIKQLFILPEASEGEWVNGSTDKVISLARNYMDTRSPKAVTSVVLGTLYIDVNTEVLDELLAFLQLGEYGNVAIVDGSTGSIIYRLKDDTDVHLPDELSFAGGEFGNDLYTAYYQTINGSRYHLVVSFDRQELYSTYTSNRTFLFLMLAAAVTFVLVMGLFFSGRISKPARQLEKAMREVQQGNLNVRVNIHSEDEMEQLGNGFNHMVEELSEMIEDVYIAELYQRNAELNALKMQVQPHYLYNTLDIIRMNSLEADDKKTARLIESLSRQLRYVMGDHNERVKLRQELDCLEEYGILIKARYENRIQLNIEVEDRDLDLFVPKLLLQPFVENAVKHGLKNKPEGGTILVEVTRLSSVLQIVILNDGIPIGEERLSHIRSFLEISALGEQDREGIVSVGTKNTYDRIKLNCGKKFGFTIDSIETIGAIVTITLPIWIDGGNHVEDIAGR